jgi:3-isopropylmalate/(R)-2-methylmalate dehydratase small subunit
MTTILKGRVWVFGNSVNTDAMYPGFAMKLPIEEAAQYMFYELRPGWVEQVGAGDIVVGGRNFGVGSSRSVGQLFRNLGVQALLAEQLNSLFYRNCINFGLPALSITGVSQAFRDGDIAEVDVAEGWVRNQTTGQELRGPGLPQMMLDILDAGGLMQRLAREGYMP